MYPDSGSSDSEPAAPSATRRAPTVCSAAETYGSTIQAASMRPSSSAADICLNGIATTVSGSPVLRSKPSSVGVITDRDASVCASESLPSR
jgi:hypothetical protein